MHAVARRRFRRRPYRAIFVALALAALIVARYLLVGPAPPSPAEPMAEGTYAVERVIDGDTVIFAPRVTVRLIGVDTPETVRPEHPVEPYGPEATSFTRAFLSGGRARLSFDRERLDHYGRHLAYVWVGERMLNEELLRRPARWEPQFRYAQKVKDRFRRAQAERRQRTKECGRRSRCRACASVPAAPRQQVVGATRACASCLRHPDNKLSGPPASCLRHPDNKLSGPPAEAQGARRVFFDREGVYWRVATRLRAVQRGHHASTETPGLQ